jgi:hypothetical protein
MLKCGRQIVIDSIVRTSSKEDDEMKRQTFPFLFAVMIVFSTLPLLAQGNARDTAKLMLKGQAVTVEYGRPSLKGRSVEQMLEKVPAGGVWRLGADKSTTFSTGSDLIFGAVAVPKGEYSLWARKEAGGTWKLVFNKQTGQWGTEHDAAQDLAAVALTTGKAAPPAEQVTIGLAQAGAGATISIAWGDLKLSTDFKAK